MLSELIMTDPKSLMESLSASGHPTPDPNTPLTEEQKQVLMSSKKTCIKTTNAKSNEPPSPTKGSIAIKVIRKEKTIITQGSHRTD